MNKAIKCYYVNKNKIVDLLINTMDNYEIHKILKDMELNINGSYLNEIGIKKGKNIGKVLQYILKLKLNIGINDDEKYLSLNLGAIIKCL